MDHDQALILALKIGDFYRDTVMKLTLDVEVDYLRLQRGSILASSFSN